jgi:hypothetical protein
VRSPIDSFGGSEPEPVNPEYVFYLAQKLALAVRNNTWRTIYWPKPLSSVLPPERIEKLIAPLSIQQTKLTIHEQALNMDADGWTKTMRGVCIPGRTFPIDWTWGLNGRITRTGIE